MGDYGIKGHHIITSTPNSGKKTASVPCENRGFFICISSTELSFLFTGYTCVWLKTVGKNPYYDCVLPPFYALMVFEMNGSMAAENEGTQKTRSRKALRKKR